MKYVYVFVWVILGAIVVLRAFAGPLYYTSDPIEAWVVDAETGQPIEGAVVTANWQLISFMGFDTGGGKRRQLEVMETTTDSKGRFHFPGFTKPSLTFDELRDEDPRIHIFKPGYKDSGAQNDYRRNADPGAHRRSSANGTTFRLVRSPDIKKYAREITSLGISLSPILESRYADKIPIMVLYLNCEVKRITKSDPTNLVSVPTPQRGELRCA